MPLISECDSDCTNCKHEQHYLKYRSCCDCIECTKCGMKWTNITLQPYYPIDWQTYTCNCVFEGGIKPENNIN